MEQDTLDLILQNRREFERLARLPFADEKTYRVFRDKAKTAELARRIGIPHPCTVLPSGPGRVVEETEELSYPLVVKPRHGWSGQGIRYVENPAQLPDAYRQVHQIDPSPLVQETIPQGEKYHVDCLLDEDSRPIAIVTLRELRHYPLRDGLSTAQESVWRPDIAELAVEILRANNWYGVACIDFMIDPRDDTPVLMEVNPRFWGPLQTPITCGVNFPYLLYRLARGEKVEPVLTYEVGVICRALLPYEILHFVANPDRFQMQPSFFDFFGPKIHYHIISAHDWLPMIGFFLNCTRYLFNPKMWKRPVFRTFSPGNAPVCH
jgi:predicted ATP-grasp superfamily ATP-dependent carboligase